MLENHERDTSTGEEKVGNNKSRSSALSAQQHKNPSEPKIFMPFTRSYGLRNKDYEISAIDRGRGGKALTASVHHTLLECEGNRLPNRAFDAADNVLKRGRERILASAFMNLRRYKHEG